MPPPRLTNTEIEHRHLHPIPHHGIGHLESGENLLGLAAEQEVEPLVEEEIALFAKLFIEIGHLPAAALVALGRILR